MEKKMNPFIECDVKECKYNCTENMHCSLERIKVAHTCECANECCDTLCDSFECRQEK